MDADQLTRTLLPRDCGLQDPAVLRIRLSLLLAPLFLRLTEQEEDLLVLRRMVQGLCARVVIQSELLSRQAEKKK